jgi:hypothetical protein
MLPRSPYRALVGISMLLLLSACASPPTLDPAVLAPTAEQTKLRSLQTRTFEVSSRAQAIRGVIASLQDLGFIIERANAEMGLVTAARFAEPRYSDVLAVTVTVRPQKDGKMMIRANAIFNNKPIDDPEAYQNFFASLERALFIGRD